LTVPTGGADRLFMALQPGSPMMGRGRHPSRGEYKINLKYLTIRDHWSMVG